MAQMPRAPAVAERLKRQVVSGLANYMSLDELRGRKVRVPAPGPVLAHLAGATGLLWRKARIGHCPLTDPTLRCGKMKPI
jgi:hypothetical protein